MQQAALLYELTDPAKPQKEASGLDPEAVY